MSPLPQRRLSEAVYRLSVSLSDAPSSRRCVFRERELTFTFTICCRPSSVCRLSVTLVRPTQAVVIFGNFSTAFGALAFL